MISADPTQLAGLWQNILRLLLRRSTRDLPYYL
jgi:hypothetical protein